MKFVCTEEMRSYIAAHEEEFFALLKELAQIPAPSNHEEKRAAYLKALVEGWGAEDVVIDEALNVVIPLGTAKLPAGPDGEPDLVVFSAHTDVVFPDMTPLPFYVDGDRVCCPGVGDDTESMTAMLMVLKYMLDGGISPKEGGILFVCNSGEEGLGNLKGIRKICETYKGRIRLHITFDSKLNHICDRAVGSVRFRVTAITCGGHSYSAFGNPNAIAHLAEVIGDIYRIEVPKRGHTTYNVGVIEGGTSVNTIAQQASMLCEFRSDDRQDLAEMQEHFDRIFDAHRSKDVSIEVETVGVRPCEALGEASEALRREMLADAKESIERITGEPLSFSSGSTDSNIPLSEDIPSICVGTYQGGGTHTREEYILRSSFRAGYEIAFETVFRYM